MTIKSLGRRLLPGDQSYVCGSVQHSQ